MFGKLSFSLPLRGYLTQTSTGCLVFQVKTSFGNVRFKIDLIDLMYTL
jgi:hypothetical protein